MSRSLRGRWRGDNGSSGRARPVHGLHCIGPCLPKFLGGHEYFPPQVGLGPGTAVRDRLEIVSSVPGRPSAIGQQKDVRLVRMDPSREVWQVQQERAVQRGGGRGRVPSTATTTAWVRMIAANSEGSSSMR
jgi:hypothetical protein